MKAEVFADRTLVACIVLVAMMLFGGAAVIYTGVVASPPHDPKPVSLVMFTVCDKAAAMSVVFDTGQVIVVDRPGIVKLSGDFMDSLLRAVPDKGVAVFNYAPVWCGIKS